MDQVLALERGSKSLLWNLVWLWMVLIAALLGLGFHTYYAPVRPPNIVLSGRILPFRTVNVAPSASGLVSAVLVSRGTHVTAGQALAVLQGARQVKAPHAGTVLSVSARRGESARAGSPLFKMADLSYLLIEVPVSCVVARQITSGSPVVLRLPTEPRQEVSATVSSVVATPESHIVQITIPNPHPGTILIGERCEAEFQQQR